ncbi:hypothetical protein BaRGS_00034705, partial [Batillaria attramentaria]
LCTSGRNFKSVLFLNGLTVPQTSRPILVITALSPDGFQKETGSGVSASRHLGALLKPVFGLDNKAAPIRKRGRECGLSAATARIPHTLCTNSRRPGKMRGMRSSPAKLVSEHPVV